MFWLHKEKLNLQLCVVMDEEKVLIPWLWFIASSSEFQIHWFPSFLVFNFIGKNCKQNYDGLSTSKHISCQLQNCFDKGMELKDLNLKQASKQNIMEAATIGKYVLYLNQCLWFLLLKRQYGRSKYKPFPFQHSTDYKKTRDICNQCRSYVCVNIAHITITKKQWRLSLLENQQVVV